MKRTQTEHLTEAAERKAARRLKKRRPKMRVHSAGLRDLARRLARKKIRPKSY